MNDLISYLGRFHPVILHLPIGSFILTFLLAGLNFFKKNYSEKSIELGLGFSFFSAVITSILGFILFKTGEYQYDSIKIHLILGIVSTLMIGLIWMVYIQKKSPNFFMVLFFLAVVLLSLTGHFGGIITHGEQYLQFPKKENEEAFNLLDKDSLKLYDEVIVEILDKKCVPCHNSTKQKGGLAMHTRDAIIKGGENGAIFFKGDTEKSKLTKYPKLPTDHKMHMPPSGRPQLSNEEIYLIDYWVNNGANFENKIVMSEPELIKNLKILFPQKELSANPPKLKDIKNLIEKKFRLEVVSHASNLITAKFMGKLMDRSSVDALLKIKDQLIELNVSDVVFEKYFFEKLSKFSRLEKLKLQNSAVENKDLEFLFGIPLKWINLSGTKINFEGLKLLSSHPKLKKIYATHIASKPMAKDELLSSSKIEYFFRLDNDFTEMQELQNPILEVEKNLFLDSINVRFSTIGIKGNKIHYTLDGSEPDSLSDLYNNKITIYNSSKLKAKSFKNGWIESQITQSEFFKVKTKIADFNFETTSKDYFNGTEAKGNYYYRLFDFSIGNENFFSDYKRYLPFDSKLIFSIDIAEKTELKEIILSCANNIDAGVMHPKSVKIFAKGENHKFELIGSKTFPREKSKIFKKLFVIPINHKNQTNLKLEIEKYEFPKWHPRLNDANKTNDKTWLFMDELLLM